MQVLVQSILYLIACGVLIVGWKRHRQLGFLILAAWAGVVATWTVAGGIGVHLISSAAPFINMDQLTLRMLLNVSSGAIMAGLLVLGVCVLVFQRGKQSAP